MHRVASLLLGLSLVIVAGACAPAPSSSTTSGAPSSAGSAAASGSAPAFGSASAPASGSASGSEPTPVAAGSGVVVEPGAVGGEEARPIGPADLAAATAAWAAIPHDAYVLRVRFGCECLLTGAVAARVQGGAVTAVQQDGRDVELASVQGFPLTVDAILAEAQATLDGGGTVTGSFTANGIPASLDLDRDLQAVDDELHVEILGIDPG